MCCMGKGIVTTNVLLYTDILLAQNAGREPEQLRQEKQCVLKSTQELAFSNYKRFIQTAECTNSIFKEVTHVFNILVALAQECILF